MGREKTQLLSWTRCRGRDGWDAPQDIPADRAEECLNVHFFDGGLATKRGGTASQSITTGSFTTTKYVDLTSWVPGQDPALRELWVFTADSGGKIGRVAAGTTAANITPALSFNLAGQTRTSTAGLNGKLFMATGNSRLQVFDPGYSTTSTRKVGMATPAAATVANNLTGGSYPATLRYYKIAFTEQQSSVTIRRSDLSDSVSFTPDGSHTAAVVSKPASVSEAETHWEIYASVDDVTYYGPIATTAVGTGTVNDTTTATAAAYSAAYDLAPVAGANKPFPGCKFIYSNGTRLFGFGKTSQDTSALTVGSGTVYFSPALDSSSIADEERCQDTVTARGALLLGRNAGGVDRGLSGLGNTVVAFQSQGVYGLVPTENPDTPFRRVQYSDSVGAVSHASIVSAEDEKGRPCLYFLDPIKGPFRLGQDGLRWVGKDVFDIWTTCTLDTASTTFWPHGIYYQAKRQVWFWVNASGSAAPSAMIVLDIPEQREDEDGNLRGGWSKWTGTLTTLIGSCMMADTLGSTMSLALKPYAADGSSVFVKADTGSGDSVQGYIQSGAILIEPIVANKGITNKAHLLAQAASGVTITQTFIRNFGDETNRTDTVSLTAAGSETHVLKEFEATALQDFYLLQVRLGDGSAAANQWVLDRWYAEADPNEFR